LEHVALDCEGNLHNKRYFFIVFKVNGRLLTIFIELSLEQISLTVQMGHRVGEELKPHKAVFLGEFRKVHIRTNAQGVVEAL
jgi:hypothetical protein